ncbi:chemotaxis protein CheW, partial [Hydrogenivirga sp. 128-5-R1-1]|uniref:chemotaxis protein CheW n=1 Tax=Hydrogenivirga sp. 128-5-R1-1 TaxID=392423 RepID=UPI00015F0B77
LLICVENLFGLSKEKCKNIIGKTAITVSVYDNQYSLVVDEIIKIQEIENTGSSSDVVNFYKVQDKVLEEITPEFLKLKIKVPSFKQLSTAQKGRKIKEEKNDEEKTFIIFTLGNKPFAINTDYLKKVEYIDNLEGNIAFENEWIEGVYLVKGTPVKTGNLKKLFGINDGKEENLLILEKENKSLGIKVDDIVDIYSIKKDHINEGTNENNILKDFFVYDKKVVSVLSEKFLDEAISKYSLKYNKTDGVDKTQHTKHKEIDILIINILGEKFAIKMEDVAEVLEYDDVNISNYPTENKFIKGLAAYKNQSFFLVSFEEVFNKEINIDENVRIILIEKNGKYIGILASDIEDIVSVPEENIAQLDNNKTIIGGNVILDKEIVNLLNINWLISNEN